MISSTAKLIGQLTHVVKCGLTRDLQSITIGLREQKVREMGGGRGEGVKRSKGWSRVHQGKGSVGEGRACAAKRKDIYGMKACTSNSSASKGV